MAPDGTCWITGSTDSHDFPVTADALQSELGGGPDDVYVARLSPDQGSLLYASFIGGTGAERAWVSLSEDGTRLVLNGSTSSSDFPTTPGSFDSTYNGGTTDGVVFEIAVECGPVDTSVPSVPATIDDGPFTSDPTQLHASWSSSDPESGIAEYQYAIGTAPADPGSGYLVDWKSAGTATEETESGLALQPNETYYWYVKAKNGAGLWSEVGISDGISVDITPPGTQHFQLLVTGALPGAYQPESLWAPVYRFQVDGSGGAMTALTNISKESFKDPDDIAELSPGIFVTADRSYGHSAVGGLTIFSVDRAGQQATILGHASHPDMLAVIGLGVDISRAHVYVATNGRGLFRFICQDGQLIFDQRFFTSGRFGGVVVSPNHQHLLATTYGAGVIRRFAIGPEGDLTEELPSVNVPGASLTEHLRLDGRGDVYVCDSHGPSMHRLQWLPDGALTYTGDIAVCGSGGVAFSPDGQEMFVSCHEPSWCPEGTKKGVHRFAYEAAIDSWSHSDFVELPGACGLAVFVPESWPLVIDDGLLTTDPTQLHASWSSSDPESGIAEYQYAIGTSATDPRNGYLVDWKSADTATEAMETGLALEPNETYYWYVRAKNGAGLWGEVGVSDGIQYAPKVEWPVSEGGNGHFYQAVLVPEGIRWNAADVEARRAGGYLASITSAAENDLVYELVAGESGFWAQGVGIDKLLGPWLGGWQPHNSPEPVGGWQWVSGEMFSYSNWAEVEPSNSNAIEDRLQFIGMNSSPGPEWNDFPIAGNPQVSHPLPRGYVIEYDPAWTQVYFSDFESDAGAEWSDQTTDVTPGTTAHPADRFLGRFANRTVTLELGGLPPHGALRVEFDLYTVLSWDGNCVTGNVGNTVGPDLWDFGVAGGPSLVHTTFALYPWTDANGGQAYPDQHPSGHHPGRTGASESNTLGYIYNDGFYPNNPEDAVYRMSFVIPHASDTIALTFSGSGLEDVSNESWGIDNVQVRVLTEPTPPPTPTVTDDGSITTDPTQLHATWSSSDPKSGIAEYQYAIGTSPTDPGSGYVVDWKSAGTATEATETGLGLVNGETYYWYVKAKNGVGLWSEVGVSDGITVSIPAQSPVNGHHYQMIPGWLTWTEARDAAAGMSFAGSQGHLATITSPEERDWLTSSASVWNPSGFVHFWLGGYQDTGSPGYSEPGGGWRWVTAEPWSWTDWKSGEPNNTFYNSDPEGYLEWQLAEGGGWNDFPHYGGIADPVYHVQGYLVEYGPVDETPPSEPTVVTGKVTVADSLQAQVSAEDPETGIDHFQYAVLTCKDAAGAVWADAGAGPELEITGLSLTPGERYALAVRAVNGAGLEGPAGFSEFFIAGELLFGEDFEGAFAQVSWPRNDGASALDLSPAGFARIPDGWAYHTEDWGTSSGYGELASGRSGKGAVIWSIRDDHSLAAPALHLTPGTYVLSYWAAISDVDGVAAPGPVDKVWATWALYTPGLQLPSDGWALYPWGAYYLTLPAEASGWTEYAVPFVVTNEGDYRLGFTAGSTAQSGDSGIAIRLDDVAIYAAGGPVAATATTGSVELSWQTLRESGTVVHWGTTAGLNHTQSVPGMVTSHALTVGNLSADTGYFFKAESPVADPCPVAAEAYLPMLVTLPVKTSLTNTGFETGQLGEWVPFRKVGGPWQGFWGITPHSGGFFVASGGANRRENGSIRQRFKVTPGMPYQVSVWANTMVTGAPAGNARCILAVDTGGGLNPYRNFPYKAVAGGTQGVWQKLTVDVIATGPIMTVFGLMEQDVAAALNVTAFDDFSISSDATAPSIPVVTDDGQWAASASELHATWTSADPESGIAEYQYAIGTSPADPGSGYVAGWKTAGTSPQKTETGLSLQPDVTYYWYVKARNGAGAWSGVGVSDGIRLPHEVTSVGAAKLLPDDEDVRIADVVVTSGTGALGSLCYVQEPDRSGGIAVETSAALAEGDLITVTARLTTMANGERSLVDAQVDMAGSGGPVEPLHAVLRSLAGKNWYYNPLSGVGQRGVTEPPGQSTNMTGLLIETCGWVMDADASFLFLNDGSWPWLTGVRVERANLPPEVYVWDYIRIRGIASMRKTGTFYQLLIRPRTAGDLSVEPVE